VGSFPQVSPPKHCIPLYSPSYAILAPPPHTIFLLFFPLTIYGDQYRSFNSSLYSNVPSPVSSSLLDPNTLY
jgi:hypothetical protein